MSAEDILDNYLSTPSLSLRRLTDEVAKIEDERDRYKSHSIMLNKFIWELGEAAGFIDPMETQVSLDANTIVEAVKEQLWRLKGLEK